MKEDHVPSGFPHAGFPYVKSLKGTPSRKIELSVFIHRNNSLKGTPSRKIGLSVIIHRNNSLISDCIQYDSSHDYPTIEQPPLASGKYTRVARVLVC